MIGFKTFFAVVVGSISLYLGGADLMLKSLIILVVVDYLTGLAAAWFQKTLNSYTGFKGIVKKLCYFALIALAVVFDQVLPTKEIMFRTYLIAFLLANEGLSILENMAILGVPVPPVLKNALEQYKKVQENG